jgi:hypothetical protein
MPSFTIPRERHCFLYVGYEQDAFYSKYLILKIKSTLLRRDPSAPGKFIGSIILKNVDAATGFLIMKTDYPTFYKSATINPPDVSSSPTNRTDHRLKTVMCSVHKFKRDVKNLRGRFAVEITWMRVLSAIDGGY